MPEKNPLGALRDPEDPRDIQFKSLMPPTVAVDLPRKFSLRDDIWFKAFRQKYGSCVGGAGRYIMQFYLWKWRQQKDLLSDRFIYGRSKEMDGHSGEGTWPRICLMGMFGNGAPKFERWDHNDPPTGTHEDFIASPPENIREEAILNQLPGGAVRLTSYEELKRQIFLFGPAMVSLRVYDSYDDVGDDGKIAPMINTGYRGNHENIAIGWNDDTGEIELLNQWGLNWGDEGYAFMPMNYDPSNNFPLFDMWGINDLVSGVVTAGAPIALGYPVETASPFVTQRFGERPEYYEQFGMKGHNGLDFRTINVPGKYIIAADDGEIIACNPNDGGYGKSVRIKHSWGMSIYAHNSQFLVSALDNYGQPTKVKRGQRIAVAGATGNAAGEHCHFGIRINGVKNPGFFDWVDPTPYFKEQSMTKFFRAQQGNTLGILVLEGWGGYLLWEDQWPDYQTLLSITGMSMSSPLIQFATGQNKFRIDDHGKAGIVLSGANGGPVVFENDWAEYQKLLATQGMSMNSPLITVP